ncbi:MAG TPA: hypothetical protein VEG32_14380 [Clostridia bacterium]|nr:hypothetical protein [Clostridia bacterium]
MRKLKFVPLVLIVCSFAFAADMRQVAVLDLPGRPGFDELAFAKGVLIISHPASNSVEIFDTVKRRPIGKIADMSSPRGIAVNDDGSAVYIANYAAGNIVELDTNAWRVKRTIPVEGAPESLLLVPKSHILLTTLPDKRQIAAVDLARGQQIVAAPLDGRPESLAFDTRRAMVYVTLLDGKKIIGFDNALRPAKAIPLNGSLPTGLVYDAKLDRLYVAVRYAVLALDPETGSEVSRVPVAGGIDHLALDDSSRTLFGVANGSVFLMRAEARLGEPEEVSVDVKGHTMAFDPAKRLIYVPGGREGRSKLLIMKQVAPGTADSQNASIATK